jgi:hypothetical protein
MRSTTHTYALLAVSPPAFNEIAQKMAKAGSAHAFRTEREGPVIHMQGSALTPDMEVKPGESYFEARSLLSSRTKEGRVEMRLNDQVVQMDIRKAKETVQMLAEAIEAAASDQILYQFMRERIGLDDERATRALVDFREIRHGSKGLVIPS